MIKHVFWIAFQFVIMLPTRRQQVINGCEYTDRSNILIGDVLPGITTDIFWNPIYANSVRESLQGLVWS